jgi:hypothetical protein
VRKSPFGLWGLQATWGTSRLGLSGLGSFFCEHMYPDQCIVICLSDEREYVIATRRVFTKAEADRYAKTVNAERNPMVVKASSPIVSSLAPFV